MRIFEALTKRQIGTKQALTAKVNYSKQLTKNFIWFFGENMAALMTAELVILFKLFLNKLKRLLIATVLSFKLVFFRFLGF